MSMQFRVSTRVGVARPRTRRGPRALLWLALCLPGPVLAQLPEPLPQPSMPLWTNGAVEAIARAPDGSIVFGGSFLAVNGVQRRNIARLLPDGSLDPSWNPGANGTVSAIAIDAGGAIYAGGAFTAIGGEPRERLARLSAFGAGAADPEWNPGADDTVTALALGAGPALYAGGKFGVAAGAFREHLAKLSTAGAGAADAAWNPGVDGAVHALAHDAATDMLYVGGEFAVVGGILRASVARIDGSGGVDPGWDPGSDNGVYSLQLDGKGSLYAGGNFSQFAGQLHTRLARVSVATGAGDAAWSPTIVGGVRSIALDDARLYVAGDFNQVDGLPRGSLAAVSTVDGTLDPGFAPRANAAAGVVAAFGDGIVYAGSALFTNIDGFVRLGFARLGAGGALLAAVDVMNPGTAYAVLPLPDGSTLVGGSFYFAGAAPRQNLYKLDANRLLDPQWAPPVDGFVYALALDEGGASVYATGNFLGVAGVPQPYLAKLATTGAGALDAAWNPAPNGSVQTIAVAAGGAVYVGGQFTRIGGGARNFIAKLGGSNAALVAGWGVAGASNSVDKIAVAPDGSVFVSGGFSFINGQARSGFAKLDPATGAADPGWAANFSTFQLARAMLFEGNAMYVGGNFSSLGGLARSHLAKVSVTSPAVVDPDWAPIADATVNTLAFGSGGMIVAGGAFLSVDSQLRPGLAMLSSAAGATLDPLWAPEVQGIVHGMAFEPNGDLVFGGHFFQVGSQPRQGIAALPGTVVRADPLYADGFE